MQQSQVYSEELHGIVRLGVVFMFYIVFVVLCLIGFYVLGVLVMMKGPFLDFS